MLRRSGRYRVGPVARCRATAALVAAGLVEHLVLLSPAAFAAPDEARRQIGGRSWLAGPPVATTLVLAEDDRTVPAGPFAQLLSARIAVVRLGGSHLPPLERPTALTAVIAAAAGNAGPSTSVVEGTPP